MSRLSRNSLFGDLDFGELVCGQFSAKFDESLNILLCERAATTILPSIIEIGRELASNGPDPNFRGLYRFEMGH